MCPAGGNVATLYYTRPAKPVLRARYQLHLHEATTMEVVLSSEKVETLGIY